MRNIEKRLSQGWLLCVALTVIGLPIWVAADCEWTPASVVFDSVDVFVAATFDDGSGEALYVGGEFTYRAGLTMNHIAKWDGTNWSALTGPLGNGTNGNVHALAVWDDGSGPALYVGGGFSSAGGLPVAHNIAKWDGTDWSMLTGGFGGTVAAMAVYDDGTGSALFVGGTVIGGANLSMWDGTSWTAVPGAPEGVFNGVRTLAVYDNGSGNDLYVGGDFESVSGMAAFNVARWNGSQWSLLAGDLGQNGVSGPVNALTVFDDGGGSTLYVGGSFATASGVTTNNIASWGGTGWSSLTGPSGTGVGHTNPINDAVNALTVYDDGSGSALYAGGVFNQAGGVGVANIAEWNGSAWSVLSGPSGWGVGGEVAALAVFDDGTGEALFAGGEMLTAGGVVVNHLAKWDGSAWSALPEGLAKAVTVSNGAVYSTALWDDGNGLALYVGGLFNHAGGVWTERIAKWDGTQWSALVGPSANGIEQGAVNALAVYDDGTGPALYAGGAFYKAGGQVVNYVAKWDGTQWSALTGPSGTGIWGGGDEVYAMAVFDDGGGPELYVGGRFDHAGGVFAYNFARWDGTQWSALPGFSNATWPYSVRALTVWDDGGGEALYVGGIFEPPYGPGLKNIAKFDGTAFSALQDGTGEGTDGEVDALAVYDDGSGSALFVGGKFEYAAGWFASRIAKWSGSAWSILSPSGSPGVFGGTEPRIWDLVAYDPGNGSLLYVGGRFDNASGATMNNIAAWDGSAWLALADAMGIGVGGGPVKALVGYDDDSGRALWVGGDFSVAPAAGYASPGLARYVYCATIFSDGFESGGTYTWDYVLGGQ